MSNTSTGEVIAITPVEQAGQYEKRFVAIKTEGDYPKTPAFEFFGKHVEKVQSVQVGQRVTVSFEPNANEYKGKWYSTNSAWKIEVHGQAGSRQAQGQPEPFANTQDDEDDIL